MGPYVIEITQGETLFLDLAIRDETAAQVSVADAAKSVEVGAPVPEADFAVSLGAETNRIEVRAAQTAAWPIGQYPLQVWLDWGAEVGIRHEVIFEAVISVRSKP